MRAAETEPLLGIRDLVVQYRQRRGKVLQAVDRVTVQVAEHETVGLVGESGSGKSTIARAVLGLAPVTSGEIRFAGADITHASRAVRRGLSRHLQIVFQDPYGSLSPGRTIGQTLAEPLHVHEQLEKDAVAARVATMLERVGLDPTAALRFPRQFSGGQRQRIAIARALMLAPQLVICDEPVSSLDLSIQAQVLNLLRDLQGEFGVSYLFIAHDLSVVRYISDQVVVLYHGRIMESGPADLVYESPAHPYTRALLAAAPVASPKLQRARRTQRGRSSATQRGAAAGTGCPFMPRCPYAIPDCAIQPALERTAAGSLVACIRAAELPPWSESLRVAAHE